LPTRWSPYDSVIPPAIAWGFAALVVMSSASLVVAHGRLRSWRPSERSARESRAHWLVSVAVVVAVAAAIGVGPIGSQSGEGGVYGFIRVGFYAVELMVAYGLAVAAFSIAGGGKLRERWRLTLFSLAVSLTVGAVVFAVPGAGLSDAAVALPVGIAAVWVASGWIAFHADGWGITQSFPRVEHSREERAALEFSVAEAMAALAPRVEAEASGDPVPATWTPQNALLLTSIGPGRIACDLRPVLINAKAIVGAYPTLTELEEGIGRLEASGLVKVVRPGWFRATKDGRAVLKAARRLRPGFSVWAGSDGLASDVLREVECRAGRVRIGREDYRRALKRVFGL